MHCGGLNDLLKPPALRIGGMNGDQPFTADEAKDVINDGPRIGFGRWRFGMVGAELGRLGVELAGEYCLGGFVLGRNPAQSPQRLLAFGPMPTCAFRHGKT